MQIIIPCRSLHGGKTRLAPCLDAEARRKLCERLLRQTLDLAARLVAPDCIRVVSADEEAHAIAGDYRVRGLHEPGVGLNAALESARASLRADDAPADAILILPIDLPFATADVLHQANSRAGDIVIAPDASGTGTNLLLLRSAGLWRLPFCFGPGSYAAHLAAARAHGLTATTFRDRRIAFDIDQPEHYRTWRANERAEAGA